MREAHPVESDDHRSTKTDVVLQGDLCPGDLPRPRLLPQLPAQLCTLSQTWATKDENRPEFIHRLHSLSVSQPPAFTGSVWAFLDSVTWWFFCPLVIREQITIKWTRYFLDGLCAKCYLNENLTKLHWKLWKCVVLPHRHTTCVYVYVTIMYMFFTCDGIKLGIQNGLRNEQKLNAILNFTLMKIRLSGTKTKFL